MRISKSLFLLAGASHLALIAPVAAQVTTDPQGNTAVGVAAGSVVLGSNNTAVGTSSGQVVAGDANVAIGLSAGQSVTGSGNVSIGTSSGSQVGGNRNVSIGISAGTSGSTANDTIEIGTSAAAITNFGVSVGFSTAVTGANGTAIGSGASVSGSNSVAIGAGSDDGAQANVVSVGSTGRRRRVTNVADGLLDATSSDAVTGSQLFSTNQNIALVQAAATFARLRADTANSGLSAASAIFGAGASYDAATGSFQAPSFFVRGKSYSDVASALAALDNDVTQSDTIAVRYDDQGRTSVSLGGGRPGLAAQPVAVMNVAAGNISASSTDAVNGSQLFSTNQNVVAAQSSADHANNGLKTAAAALGGGASYNPSTGVFSAPTYVVAGSAHSDVGSALAALDNEISGVSAAAANSVQYDDAAHSAVTLGGAGAVPVSVRNVAAATLSASSTDAVNGSQLFATNQQVAQNTMAIAANATQTSALSAAISNGTVGLVQQTGGNPAGQITVGAATGGKSVSVAGTSGTRTVTGVSAGTISATSTDAINGSQLFALSEHASLVDGRIVALQHDLEGVKYDLRQIRKDANSGIATAVALGALPQATNPGRFAVGMGTGIRDGQLAVAIGASWRSKDDMFVVNLRGGYDQSSVTAGAGVGIEF